MPYTPPENFPQLIDAMKRAAMALRDAEVPFLLGGGLAAWARGGPPTEHDVDLIFHPAGGPIDDGYFERAEAMEVMAQPLLVCSLDDVMATKLLAINEQTPDFASVLELARSLREQIDWDAVRERTESSPFARAFFTLIEELGIVARSAANNT